MLQVRQTHNKMKLQQCLAIQIRSTFRTPPRPHRIYSCQISSSSVRRKASRTKVKDSTSLHNQQQSPKRNWPYNVSLSAQSSTNISLSTSTPSQDGKELIPRQQPEQALNSNRQVPVPVRVIPQAEINRNVRLTPRERLHIEVLTRQLPQRLQTVHGEEQKTYRERLQIYHVGLGSEIAMSLLRVFALFAIPLSGLIFLPAHIAAGSAFWKLTIISIGMFVPSALVHLWTQPMVTRIFLPLPLKARQSSKTAMEYAKNLPADAQLELKYFLPYGLEGTSKAKISELVPVYQERNLLKPSTWNWLRPVTFRRISSRKSARFEPRDFYVNAQTKSGKQSKDTIPGIWEGLFNQLLRVRKESMTKWKKPVTT